jgi:hypothetical protein
MDDLIKTVSFFGTVSAGSEVTLVSDRISSPFEVQSISAHFALNQARTVLLSFFIAPDKSAPATGKPTGFNILAEYGHVDYIAGDDDTKQLTCQANSQSSPSWLKVYAINSDTYDHSIDVQITIKILPRA